MGTGGFRSLDVLEGSLVASEASVATVALRRVDPSVEGSIYDVLKGLGFDLLPNTAGCYSAAEAFMTLMRPAGSRPITPADTPDKTASVKRRRKSS